jgi:hypothetical protein
MNSPTWHTVEDGPELVTEPDLLLILYNCIINAFGGFFGKISYLVFSFA